MRIYPVAARKLIIKRRRITTGKVRNLSLASG
jgi:hypothetical protein